MGAMDRLRERWDRRLGQDGQWESGREAEEDWSAWASGWEREWAAAWVARERRRDVSAVRARRRRILGARSPRPSPHI